MESMYSFRKIILAWHSSNDISCNRRDASRYEWNQLKQFEMKMHDSCLKFIPTSLSVPCLSVRPSVACSATPGVFMTSGLLYALPPSLFYHSLCDRRDWNVRLVFTTNCNFWTMKRELE
jgi:hypothetical protein